MGTARASSTAATQTPKRSSTTPGPSGASSSSASATGSNTSWLDRVKAGAGSMVNKAGDVWNDTTAAVGEAWDQGTEAVGDAVRTGGAMARTAGAAIDAGFGDGEASVSLGDVKRSVGAFSPDSVKALDRMIALDPKLESAKVNATRVPGGMKLALPDINAARFALADFQTGAIKMSGVSLFVRGQGSKPGGSALDLGADLEVSVGTVTVDKLQHTADPTFSADRLTLLAAKLTMGARLSTGVAVDKFDVGSATLSGVKSAHGDAKALQAGDLSVALAPHGGTVNADALTATGLNAGGATGDSVAARGFSATFSQQAAAPGRAAELRAQANVRQLDVTKGAVGSASFDTARLQNARLSTGGGATQVGVDGAQATGIRTPQAQIGGATADGVSATMRRDAAGATTTNASARAATATKAQVGPGVSFGSARLDNGRLTAGAGGVQASADKLAATEVAAHGATAHSANATGARLDQSAGKTQVSAASLGATKLTAGGVSVGDLRARDAAATVAAGGTRATVGQLNAAAIDAGAAKAASARISALDAHVGADGQRATAASAGARGVTAGPAKVGAVDLSGVAVDNGSAGLNASAAKASARDVSAGSASAAAIDVDAVKLANNAAGLDASAARAAARDVKAGPAAVAELGATDVKVATNAGGLSATASKADARGISAGPVSANTAAVADLGVRTTADGVAATAKQASVRDIAAGGAKIATVDASDLAVNSGAAGLDATAAKGSATDVRSGNVALERADLTNVSAGTSGETRLAAAGVDANKLTVGEDVEVERAKLANARMSLGAKATRVDVDSVNTSAVRAGDSRAADLNASGVSATLSEGGTRTGVAKLAANDLTLGANGQVGHADLSRLAVNTSAKGTNTSAAAVNASDLKFGSFSARTAAVGDANVTTDPALGTTTADAARIGATGVTVGAATKIDNAQLRDASAVIGREGLQQAGAGTVAAFDVATQVGGTKIEADTLGTGAVKLANDRVDARNVSATGVDVRTGQAPIAEEAAPAPVAAPKETPAPKAETAPSPAANANARAAASAGTSARATASRPAASAAVPSWLDLARQGASLVDSADLQASNKLPADRTYGDGIGRVTTSDRSEANARVKVEDGHLVPGQTGVKITPALDAWGFVGVNGVNLDGKRDAAEVELDLKNMFNLDITDKVADRETLPTALPSLVDFAADKLSPKPANATTPASAAKAPARTTTPPARATPPVRAEAAHAATTPGKSSTPTPTRFGYEQLAADLTNSDTLRASGRVGLGVGTLAQGDASVTTAAAQRATDNQIGVSYNAAEGAALSFVRMLLGSVTLPGGATLDGVSAEGGAAKLQPRGNEIQGSIGRLDVKSVSAPTK